MARPPRLEFPGATYHVTARGNERSAIFRDDADRERYLDRLRHYRQRFGFRILAFCLMDNHVHLVLETGRFGLSRIMAGLQSSYTQWFNRRHRRVGHLFQGRYKAFVVQKDRYLLALVRYVHLNPVRARAVRRAADYQWSSASYFETGSGPEWVDLDMVLSMLGQTRAQAGKAYRSLLAQGEGEGYEDLEPVGQVVKGDERFAERQFRRLGEPEMLLRGLSESRVVGAVAVALGLTVEDLRGPWRRRPLSEGRAIAGYIGKRLGGISWSRMARYLHRDGSTLVREVGRLEAEVGKSPAKRERIEAIMSGLRQGRNT